MFQVLCTVECAVSVYATSLRVLKTVQKLAQEAGAPSAARRAEQGMRDRETYALAKNFDLRAACYRQGPTPDRPFGTPFLQPVRVFWDAENIRFNQMWYAALQTALAGRGRVRSAMCLVLPEYGHIRFDMSCAYHMSCAYPLT